MHQKTTFFLQFFVCLFSKIRKKTNNGKKFKYDLIKKRETNDIMYIKQSWKSRKTEPKKKNGCSNSKH